MARERMVERQLRRGGIADWRVLAAMGAVPRERFVPAAARGSAYSDGALAIGEGQTASQPRLVASMIELLGLRGHERVLEVGTGSGYAAAVLSLCCAEVVSVERRPALAERARAVLAELGYEGVEVRIGDGARGVPERAPFGGAVVAAAVEGRVPPALLEQLVEGALVVCPLRRGGEERLVRLRAGGGPAREEDFGPVRFVPLVSGGETLGEVE